jgi:mono/diheme cytochrome c family protein
MNLPRAFVFIAMLLAALTGCDSQYSGELVDDGFNAAGQAHYVQQCSSCHGIDGNGTSVGPSLVGCATC